MLPISNTQFTFFHKTLFLAHGTSKSACMSSMMSSKASVSSDDHFFPSTISSCPLSSELTWPCSFLTRAEAADFLVLACTFFGLATLDWLAFFPLPKSPFWFGMQIFLIRPVFSLLELKKFFLFFRVNLDPCDYHPCRRYFHPTYYQWVDQNLYCLV